MGEIVTETVTGQETRVRQSQRQSQAARRHGSDSHRPETWTRQSQRQPQARRHGWDSHRPGDMGETVTGQETWVGQSQARRHG